jgi:uncharacterized integral membrane protein
MGVILALPFLVVLVIFALSNRQTVDVGFWPLDYGVEAPLSVAVLVGMALAFVFGGLLVWGAAIGQRRRARRAEADVRMLREQVAGLKDRLARPVAQSSGAQSSMAAALPPPG